MEIILLESLNKLGKAGEIVKVKDGYAKNFLIPQKKAIVANKKNKSDLDSKMSDISKLNESKVKEANDVKSNISEKKIILEMEANDDGNLYGAVTQKSIVENIYKNLSIELSADSVMLYPIKTLGNHEIKIRLYDEIEAQIILEITKKAVSYTHLTLPTTVIV